MKKFFNQLNILPGFFFMAGLLLFSSCKKLIGIPANLPSQIPQQAVFADSAGTMGAVAAVYSYYFNGFAFEDGALSRYTGLSADELATSSTDPGTAQFYTDALTTDNANVGTFWTNIYASMYRVNACLTGVGSSTGISDALKQQLTGEMKVVRALYYFNLVNLFGGVPLVLSTDYNMTATLPRSTADEVYTQILADLSDAQKALTVNYPSDGRARPNLYVAEALLAKVNLYRGQWQAAYDLANAVIGSGNYQLETDPGRVFLDGSVEAIWHLPANGANTQTNEAMNFVPYAPYITPTYFFTSDLTGIVEPNDLRWPNWTGANIINVNGTDQTFYYPYKYKNVYGPFSTTEDFMVFRLAELYLIRAEAAAHLNNLPVALDDLNQVRSRAGLTNSAAATQTDLLDAIMRERRVELFCEWGNRWFDLKRTKTADAVLGSLKPGWQSNAALYPVPYKEIRNNTRLVQNPGYN